MAGLNIIMNLMIIGAVIWFFVTVVPYELKRGKEVQARMDKQLADIDRRKAVNDKWFYEHRVKNCMRSLFLSVDISRKVWDEHWAKFVISERGGVDEDFKIMSSICSSSYFLHCRGHHYW